MVGERYDKDFAMNLPILLNAIFNNLDVTQISATQIINGSITATKIADGTITGAKIAAATIEGQNIAADAIGATHIASNTISADDIQTDAITTTKLQAGSVTAAKIAAGTITSDKLNITELSAITAALGEVTSGILTAATMRTSADPADSRVLIDSAGLRGYDDTLGLTFRIPTDGSSPLFASGQIQNATIIDTTIISNDFKTSSELPWLEFSDSGAAYRETLSGDKYGSGVQYGDGTLYGVGVTAYYGNSSRPVLSVEKERVYADLRLYNRTTHPSGACVVGDLIVLNGKLKICTSAGTGPAATWEVVGDQAVASSPSSSPSASPSASPSPSATPSSSPSSSPS